jgi:hypothetical protein
MNAPALSPRARPLIQLDLETAAFAANWGHCDQIANYLALMASFDRADTFLYSNLLSTVLNELFELVFVRHQPTGCIKCTLLRDGQTDRIELRIPAGEAERTFFQRSVADSQASNARDLYTHSLLSKEPLEHAIGLLELSTDYGAQIWLDSTNLEHGIRLVVDVRLEDGRISNPSSELCPQ